MEGDSKMRIRCSKCNSCESFHIIKTIQNREKLLCSLCRNEYADLTEIDDLRNKLIRIKLGEIK